MSGSLEGWEVVKLGFILETPVVGLEEFLVRLEGGPELEITALESVHRLEVPLRVFLVPRKVAKRLDRRFRFFAVSERGRDLEDRARARVGELFASLIGRVVVVFVRKAQERLDEALAVRSREPPLWVRLV